MVLATMLIAGGTAIGCDGLSFLTFSGIKDKLSKKMKKEKRLKVLIELRR